MKIRVLVPAAFQKLDDPPTGMGATEVVDMPEAVAMSYVSAGYAEVVEAKSKVERATKAPGEKRAVERPAKDET